MHLPRIGNVSVGDGDFTHLDPIYLIHAGSVFSVR
jgi:hypothetical protein